MTVDLPPPPRPEDFLLPEDWPHHQLHKDLQDAIASLPSYFTSDTHIAGVNATDLYTLNSVLGAAIEEQVVLTLNAIRHTWDPNDNYSLYSFFRQPQTFPDVVLRRASSRDIILGVELKGWYMLAKEGEPSFRYEATPAICAPQDLVVVVPWALAQVLSGKPRVFEPYIASARFAAEFRNYHWRYLRRTQLDTTIVSPGEVTPYPTKSEHTADKPASDSGGNFGRFARSGVMNDWLGDMKTRLLAGIEVEHWQRFLGAFKEQGNEAAIRSALQALRSRVQTGEPPAAQAAILQIIAGLEVLLEG